MNRLRHSRRCLLLGLLAAAGCGDDVAAPAAAIDLELEGLRALDAETEGTYEAWVIGADGAILSAGRFEWPADGRVTVQSPLDRPEHLMLTVEPPGDGDGAPSGLKLLGGAFDGGTAELDVNRYVTAGIPLEANPGTHALFTPSDNAELNYPSYEDAGIWLFNVGGDTLDGSFFLTLTPLTRGWVYEGWVVRDYGEPAAIWVSYGKFTPSSFRKQDTRDDTGLGPFSGQPDYERAMPQEVVMPGDDWVANPYGYPVPGGLTLPFDLNGCLAAPAECERAGQEPGASRWTHVITIEPEADDEEEPWLARPFLLRPYRNPVGEGPPDEPRVIEYHPELLPRGTAVLVPE